jgi:hypothetical protein
MRLLDRLFGRTEAPATDEERERKLQERIRDLV